MTELAGKTCEACRIGAPHASAEETASFMKKLPGWEIIDADGIKQLHKSYQFPDFAQALSFTNRVGEISEEEGHHPAILTEWGKVTVLWWSHKIKGLHVNDFIMAAKTDQLEKN